MPNQPPPPTSKKLKGDARSTSNKAANSLPNTKCNLNLSTQSKAPLPRNSSGSGAVLNSGATSLTTTKNKSTSEPKRSSSQCHENSRLSDSSIESGNNSSYLPQRKNKSDSSAAESRKHYFMDRKGSTEKVTAKNVYDQIVAYHSNELRVAGVEMAQYCQENQDFNFDMYPSQRLCKEQCMLFLQEILYDCSRKELVARSLREGIENLYCLLTYIEITNVVAYQSFTCDLICIITILKDVINICEKLSGLKLTNWDRVTAEISMAASFVNSDDHYFLGKIAYFTLDRLLGAGGFGAVYKAFLGESAIALKFVPKSMLPHISAAVADKCVATMINHPCLVKYYACFAGKDIFVTAMEYLQGVDVIRLVKMSFTLPEQMIRLIIAQLGLALIHLHMKGFIHRDVKPANMMITAGCRVKLIDFDTARFCIGKFDKKKTYRFFEKTAKEFPGNEIAGTQTHMAPEIYREEGFGRSMDWWALGVTAFELASKELPFPFSGDIQATKEKILEGQYSWPEQCNVSKEFKNLVKKALTTDVGERLCSKHYKEFLKHPFFADLNWKWVESAPVLMNFDPIATIATDQLVMKTGTQFETPQPSPAASTKLQRLFESPVFEDDTEEQQNLYVYSSPGFIRACVWLQEGLIPNDACLADPPEFVIDDEPAERYYFANV